MLGQRQNLLPLVQARMTVAALRMCTASHKPNLFSIGFPLQFCGVPVLQQDACVSGG